MLRQKAARVLLLVPAYPGCPGTKAIKQLLLLLLLFIDMEGLPSTRKILGNKKSKSAVFLFMLLSASIGERGIYALGVCHL